MVFLPDYSRNTVINISRIFWSKALCQRYRRRGLKSHNLGIANTEKSTYLCTDKVLANYHISICLVTTNMVCRDDRPFSCLFLTLSVFVPLRYEKVQYHTPRKLGRIDRQAAAHGLSSIRVRLVCCRSQNTLHDEVERPSSACFTA